MPFSARPRSCAWIVVMDLAGAPRAVCAHKTGMLLYLGVRRRRGRKYGLLQAQAGYVAGSDLVLPSRSTRVSYCRAGYAAEWLALTRHAASAIAYAAQADTPTQHRTAAAHRTMASKRAKNAAKLKAGRQGRRGAAPRAVLRLPPGDPHWHAHGAAVPRRPLHAHEKQWRRYTTPSGRATSKRSGELAAGVSPDLRA